MQAEQAMPGPCRQVTARLGLGFGLTLGLRLRACSSGGWMHKAQGQGAEHRAQGAGHRAQGAGHRVQGAGHKAQGAEHKAQAAGQTNGAGMVQGWRRDGAGMVQGWCRDGAGMAQGWGGDGAGMVQGWCRDGAGWPSRGSSSNSSFISSSEFSDCSYPSFCALYAVWFPATEMRKVRFESSTLLQQQQQHWSLQCSARAAGSGSPAVSVSIAHIQTWSIRDTGEEQRSRSGHSSGPGQSCGRGHSSRRSKLFSRKASISGKQAAPCSSCLLCPVANTTCGGGGVHPSINRSISVVGEHSSHDFCCSGV